MRLLTAYDVANARRIATAAHEGQVDKSGHPYIEHPDEVASRLPADDAFLQVVAWLHDVVEDTATTLDEIEEHFGLEVRDAVDAITHRKGESNIDYYARVLANPTALAVKEADIGTNTDPMRTRQLPKEVRDRLAAKYAKARAILGFETPAPLVPEGRIPVTTGDFVSRFGSEAIVAWAGEEPMDAALIFTKCPVGDGAWRGTAATPGTLTYAGWDSEYGHLFSVYGDWTVTSPMWS